jgi:hypothetical protein
VTDDATFVEIQQINAELAAQGGILRALLHAQGKEMAESVLAEMGKDETLARVFLLVDGLRTQKDIVEALAADGGPAVSQPTVSGKMSRLSDELGLIAPVRRAKNGTVYRATPAADALRIRQALTKPRKAPKAAAKAGRRPKGGG